MRTVITAIRESRDRGEHPGLLLQRFLAHPADGTERWSAEKRSLLSAAIASAECVELRLLYRSAFERWQQTLPAVSVTGRFRTEGRLIVGLGAESVLETGIRLHHTYGLPLVPGSALKGLAAHYCHEVWGQRSISDAPLESKRFRRPTTTDDKAYQKYLRGKGPRPEDNFFRLLFGSTDDGGCITFHDAWLIPESQKPLVMDVMTPHHPEWVDGRKPPTDFDSPVPVPFVSVAGTFQVAVSWSGPRSEQAQNWTELAFSLLTQALREWGVGGKTSSGYGRLVVIGDTTPAVGTGQAGSPGQSHPPVKRKSGTAVRVKIVEPRPKGGFEVQEPGHPQGSLTVGNPPPGVVTDVGTFVEVQVHDDDPRRPQYKWPSPPAPQKSPKKRK